MKISDGAVKLLKEYADREKKSLGISLTPSEAYGYGVQDGITILSQQVLGCIKEDE